MSCCVLRHVLTLSVCPSPRPPTVCTAAVFPVDRPPLSASRLYIDSQEPSMNWIAHRYIGLFLGGAVFSASQQVDSATEVAEPAYTQGSIMQTTDASIQVEGEDRHVVRSYDGVPGLAAGLSHSRGLARQVPLGPPHVSRVVGAQV